MKTLIVGGTWNNEGGKSSGLIKKMYDAEQMKWSNEENEYIAPLVETTISKCNLVVANSYDTFEQIQT